MNKLFSVIIPTYNRAHSIVHTLDSVKAQSYRPIEIIVVDDGSTDETEAVVRRWEERQKAESRKLKVEIEEQEAESQPTLSDRESTIRNTLPSQPSITLNYITQANAGAPAARNRGLTEAKGDYIQFLDSDDRLHPQRFELLARAFEESGADFIQTSIEWFDPESNETVNTLWARPDADQVELVLRGDFWANTLRACMRRQLSQRIPSWPEAMTCFQDRVYMETAVLQARKPIALKPILGYLARGEGMHVSNKHRSFEGRRWRIDCERKLVEQVLKRDDISQPLKSVLAARIYRIGCRSAARSWYDYARECVEIADRLNAPRSLFARIKRRLCLLGPVGGKAYHWICRAKGLPESY